MSSTKKQSSLKMCILNTGGLVSKENNKLHDQSFIQKLNNFDLVFLVETHLSCDFQFPNIGLFHVYTVCRNRSENNRHFGGIGHFF